MVKALDIFLIQQVARACSKVGRGNSGSWAISDKRVSSRERQHIRCYCYSSPAGLDLTLSDVRRSLRVAND